MADVVPFPRYDVPMNRRHFLQVILRCRRGAAPPAALLGAVSDAANDRTWDYASISDLRAAMDDKRVTASALTEYFLRRIEQIDLAGPRCARSSRPTPTPPGLPVHRTNRALAARSPASPSWSRTTSTRTTG